jgi:hypothetical protein
MTQINGDAIKIIKCFLFGGVEIVEIEINKNIYIKKKNKATNLRG